MHEIRPGLWLGSRRAACDHSALAERGVTHILSLVQDDNLRQALRHRQRLRLPPSDLDPHARLIVMVQDNTSARLDRHFEACSAFINEGLEQGCVFVHCEAGQSRSPTVVIAHLMRQEMWAADEALRFVQQRRATVRPNIGFLDQLRTLQSQLGIVEKQQPLELEECAIEFAPDVPAGADTLLLEATLATAVETCEAQNLKGSEVSADVYQDDVKVEVVDVFGVEEMRARCERMRTRCQRLRTPSGALSVAARKRRYLM